MSRELSTYEAMGGTYTEVDGLFYPNIVVSEESDVWVGKYGLERIANRYLAKHKPQNSAFTMEMWRLREQAKQMAEEVVLNDIVRQYH